MSVVSIYKKEGETPLACLERYRAAHPELALAKLTYLGRLDPMAEGVLLIGADLAPEERAQYLGLRKEYRVEVLFGISSDTYDILGIPAPGAPARIDAQAVGQALASIKGTFEQAYPPYSSKPVMDEEGKKRPLFALSRGGAAPEEMPKKEVTVYACRLLELKMVDSDALLKSVVARIKKVQGDFRQQEIMAAWERLLAANPAREFVVATIILEVSSGTYVRAIAHHLGRELCTGALAHAIVRTKVGDFASTNTAAQ